VTGAGTTTVAYDYEGRISQITYPSTATNTFTYNGLDTRVSKVDSAGTATYKRDGAHVTAPVISDGSATYTPSISERRSSTTKYYGSDRLGTNALETNSSQAVTATKTYDAFGMPVASTGSSASPFGFAGQHGYQEDADSGLKLLGHRYYDASTGRFLTRDPVKDGRNWYGYCDNNPLTQVDPDGLDAAAIEKRARKIVEDPDERKNYNDRYDDPKWDSGKSNKNTDCGVFVSECAREHDPDYPKNGTWTQKKYVEGSDNWEVIEIDDKTKPQPGDILWKPGHTEVYVGDADVTRKDKKGKPYKVTKPGQSYGGSLGGHTPKNKGVWKGRFKKIFRPKEPKK